MAPPVWNILNQLHVYCSRLTIIYFSKQSYSGSGPGVASVHNENVNSSIFK